MSGGVGRLVKLGVAAVAVAGSLTIAPGRAGALDASFQALAVGDGVRVSVFSPNAPLTNPEGRIMDFGGPVAEALLDSIGQSTAYASFPFPGAGPGTSPALIRGASGGALPVPDYPMFVQSKSPVTPKQEFGSGPLALKAESTDKLSAAAATVGGDAGGGNAVGLSKVTARTESTATAVVSSATSDTAAVAIGPLHIARVSSKADASFDGTLTKSADTVVEGVSVDGTGVVLTPEGLKLAGSDGPAADLAGVNDVLAQAKITVELVNRQDAPTGIVAPAVQVTQQDGSGGKIVYKIGAASAFVDASLLPGQGGDGGVTVTSSEARPGHEIGGVSPEGSALTGPLGGLSQHLALRNETGPVEPNIGAVPPVPAAAGQAARGPEMVLASSVPDGIDPTSERGRLFFDRSDTAPLFLILLVGAALAVAIPGLARLRGARG